MRISNGVGDRPRQQESWRAAVALYREPDRRRSVLQIITTLLPYFALWGLMYASLAVSYFITLGLAVLAAGFLTRAFIIFHDCGHGSFFKSRRANDLCGMVLGVFTFTPYYQWRKQHAIHHAAASDLDRRGTGDIWTLTLTEYLNAPRWKRLGYRLARNPVILFLVAPLYVFLIEQRFPARVGGRRERLSALCTNAALAAIVLTAGLTIGFEAYLLIQLPIIMIAGAAGVWLFYVQHQFEGVYWERGDDWDFVDAAIKGSSYYKLPTPLQWITGNIGFHHLHHLSPAIPNYNLEACHHADPLFQSVKPITMWRSLKSLTFRLWDEDRRRLVGYGALRQGGRSSPGTRTNLRS